MNKEKDKKEKKENKIKFISVNGSAFKDAEILKKNKKSFILESTNSAGMIYLKDENVKYFYSNNIYSYKELNLHKKIKKEFLKNIEANNFKVPEYCENNIKYFEISKNLYEKLEYDKKYEGFGGLDINKAYYRIAYNLGYISDEFYEMCKNLDKKIRLRLIGSVATSRKIYTFQNGKLVNLEIRENKTLRNAWFHICKITDECLLEFAQKLKNNFLMYWVDGIYFKKPITEIEKERFIDLKESIELKYDITFKEEAVDYVMKTQEKDITTGKKFDILNISKSGKIKKFFISQENPVFNRDIIENKELDKSIIEYTKMDRVNYWLNFGKNNKDDEIANDTQNENLQPKEQTNINAIEKTKNCICDKIIILEETQQSLSNDEDI